MTAPIIRCPGCGEPIFRSKEYRDGHIYSQRYETWNSWRGSPIYIVTNYLDGRQHICPSNWPRVSAMPSKAQHYDEGVYVPPDYKPDQPSLNVPTMPAITPELGSVPLEYRSGTDRPECTPRGTEQPLRPKNEDYRDSLGVDLPF